MATLAKYTGDDAFAKRNPRSCDPYKFRIRNPPSGFSGLSTAWNTLTTLEEPPTRRPLKR